MLSDKLKLVIAREIAFDMTSKVDEVMAPIDLAHALRDVVAAHLGFTPAIGYQREQAKKPHGREGFFIHLVPPEEMTVGADGFTSSPYIDLSIIHPRAA